MHGTIPPTPKSDHVARWGMVIDLNRCVGCQTCTAACKHANDTTPGVQWRRVLDVERGRFPDVERLFLVTGCQHCDEPPCVPVCPTGATRRRADGLVTMDYDQCIGCASCVVACPYQARTLVHDAPGYYEGHRTIQEQVLAHPERLGVAQKCTFCVERVDAGIAAGQTPGIDPEATPACSASCIAQAIHFGDFNDPDSNVARLARDNPSFAMHEELGTKPAMLYLYETPSVPGRAASADDEPPEMPPSALVGPLQRFWDYRAAMNFIFGGMGSGLAVVGTVLALLQAISPSLLRTLLLISGLSIATGLVFVFFKIGRKARFLYAMLRPQTSWMTREIYVVGAFYLALGADLLWPHPLLHVAVGAAAFAFLFCQARILFASKGIPAWRAPTVPAMIVATGLAEGTGLAAVALGLLPMLYAGRMLAAGLGMATILASAVFWHRYRGTATRLGAPARRALDGATPWIAGLGQAAPFALYLAALVASAGLTGPLLALAGAFAVAGGVMLKSVVILRAAYQQDFALPMLPRRGSGARAAPVLVTMA